MTSVTEVLQLCRLCLMKDQVNNPIFEEADDISQIFLKISACLPVKVSRDDSLPKKICDSCSYKLELFYDFLHSSTASEKQLITWLNRLGVDKLPASKVVNTLSSSLGSNVSPLVLKQEIVDVHSVDELSADDDLNITSESQDYDLQQQQLSYEGEFVEFQQDEFMDNDATNNIAASATITSKSSVANRKRSAAVMQADLDSEDEDNLGLGGSKMSKTEGANDSENDAEETFDIPSTSGDNDQPGPSGVGKGAPDTSSQSLTAIETDTHHDTIYECQVCSETFTSKKDFLAHHMNQFGETFTCCRCNLQCRTTTELYNHYELHKNNTIIIEENDDSIEYDYADNVETVISIPNEPINDANELLYILDGSQCVNEIVIEDENDVQEIESETSVNKSENFRIVHVEHGYMLPSIFKGKLETKRRYTRKESVVGSVEVEEAQEEVSDDREITTNKNLYLNIPKARPKRRHEVPDFSATSYIVLNPNDEIDMIHYKCLRCEQLFISKFTFFRHIEKGKCYINSCDVCSASFLKNSEFYEHYLLEHTDRAICNFCFRTFMYEKNVKEHMLRHLDQFRHRCEECNKGFYTVREYRNHYKNRHMGIRHKCDVCGRSFADEYYFKRHVATHEKAIKK